MEYRFNDECCNPGETGCIFWKDILSQADLNIDCYTFFGVVSVGVYGIMIGGWASNNKFRWLVPFVHKWYRMKLQWDCP
jgi:hypothetical protein